VAQIPDDATPPVLRIIRGTPTPEDLAVLAAVLSAAQVESSEPPAGVPPRTWAAHWRQLRPPIRPGPGAWLASSRPR
jgi:hypothetical protein